MVSAQGYFLFGGFGVRSQIVRCFRFLVHRLIAPFSMNTNERNKRMGITSFGVAWASSLFANITDTGLAQAGIIRVVFPYFRLRCSVP
jgi:hypothetical protein